MKNQAVLYQINDLFQKSQNILLSAAKSLDGDAYWCMLALYDYGRSLGKNMVMVNDTPVAEVYEFLNMHDKVLTKVPDEKFDLIIISDTWDIEMLGKVYEDNRELFDSVPVVNIDHHHSNPGFGTINFVDARITCACDLVYDFIVYAGGSDRVISPDIASYLLLGIMYDTNCYKNRNTTSQTFEMSQKLVTHGADYHGIILNLYRKRPLMQLELYGEFLSNLIVYHNDRVIGGVITLDMLSRYHQVQEGLWPTLINEFLSSIDADYVFVITEVEWGGYKLSFRSKQDKYNMAELAGTYGGGGHKLSAGGFTRMPLTEILSIIESYYSKIQ